MCEEAWSSCWGGKRAVLGHPLKRSIDPEFAGLWVFVSGFASAIRGAVRRVMSCLVKVAEVEFWAETRFS
jgi:hypothetical protein